jgi:hypothetical protein
MIVFSVYEDSVKGNLLEGAKAPHCHQANGTKQISEREKQNPVLFHGKKCMAL